MESGEEGFGLANVVEGLVGDVGGDRLRERWER